MSDAARLEFDGHPRRRARSIFMFSWHKADGAVLAWRGSVEDAKDWIASSRWRTLRTIVLPASVVMADSRQFVIGMRVGDLVVGQWERSRYRSLTQVSRVPWSEVEVGSTEEGGFVPAHIGGHLYQLLPPDAELLRAVAEGRKG